MKSELANYILEQGKKGYAMRDENGLFEIEGVLVSIGDWEPADPCHPDTLLVNRDDLLLLLKEDIGALLAMRKAAIQIANARIAELEAELNAICIYRDGSGIQQMALEAENQQLREQLRLRSWPEDHPQQFPCIVIDIYDNGDSIEIADNFDDGYWDIRGQGEWEISTFRFWMELDFPFPPIGGESNG